jgi:hypothetical protein
MAKQRMITDFTGFTHQNSFYFGPVSMHETLTDAVDFLNSFASTISNPLSQKVKFTTKEIRATRRDSSMVVLRHDDYVKVLYKDHPVIGSFHIYFCKNDDIWRQLLASKMGETISVLQHNIMMGVSNV